MNESNFSNVREGNNIENIFSKLKSVQSIIPGIDAKNLNQVITGEESFETGATELHDHFDSDYHKGFFDLELPLIIKEIKERFAGKILIDLGAGSILQEQLEIAKTLDVKTYVAVEPVFYNRLGRWMAKVPDNYVTFPISLVAEDALTFLRRLPDNSVSISAYGIDETIIHDDKEREEIEKEIERVLDKEGAFLNYGSDLNPKGLVCKTYNKTSVYTLGN